MPYDSVLTGRSLLEVVSEYDGGCLTIGKPIQVIEAACVEGR